MVESIEECIGNFMVPCSYKNMVDGFSWAFVGYMPNVDNKRKDLWDELAGVGIWWKLPWCIGDDFNITQFISERSGEARQSRATNGFSEFTFNMDLVDYHLLVVRIFGPIIAPSPVWTDFWCLPLGRLTTLLCYRRD